MASLNYRGAVLLYALVFALLILPLVIGGEVIAPHRQHSELAAADRTGANQLENRKFSDFTNGYIPEISEHLNGSRSGWLTLWINQNELGRPAYQISGFSPAYLPSWLIAQATGSPWHFITVLSLGTCFLGGLFILLFAREIGLSPTAGLLAGTGFAASPLFMYWLTFPMFPAVWCWSAGGLWAITRLAKGADIIGWSVLAFSGYSLLMTAYPQPVVFHAYLLGGYSLWLAYHQLRISRVAPVKFLALAASALVVGAALAFPVYRDLAVLSSESARVSPDPSFFTAVLPKFANFDELIRFLVLSTVPEIFGHPIAPSFPFSYDGLSVTLTVVFFSVVALFTVFNKIWGWWLAIVVLCLLAFVHPLYVLGVKFLGFNLSRSTPLGSIMLPLTIITALGIDALVKRTHDRNIGRAVLIGGLSILTLLIVGVTYGISQDVPICWGLVAGMLLVSGLLFAQNERSRPLLLMLALGGSLILTSYPLILKQDPTQIAVTSPLVEKVRANLPPGSRFAVAAPGIPVLPPNLNATLNLASVHSYNSLSSTRYHTLINELGGQMHTYGRYNGVIDPDYAGSMFWMSNISLILSSGKLGNENLEPLGEESGIYLYKVVSRMGESLQLLPPQVEMSQKKLTIGDARSLPTRTPIKILDEGDILEFEVAPMAPSVFLLSQKFHRDWQARAYINEGWQAAQTVEIDGVFQGVILPPETSRVRLDFKPLVRYAWLGHFFWFFLLVLTGFKLWQKSRCRCLENVRQ
ncbi:hypothetical protein [Allohahella sp. A8]|uniref:hypothetical protein n=1 Tax=Allohahella sp. A8 TaxID=3141461 RepID=UPI003A7FC125